MKVQQPTYIDLRPIPDDHTDAPLSPLDFHVRRNARIELKYELRKYATHAAKTAARALKTTLRDIGRGAEDCFFHQKPES